MVTKTCASCGGYMTGLGSLCLQCQAADLQIETHKQNQLRMNQAAEQTRRAQQQAERAQQQAELERRQELDRQRRAKQTLSQNVQENSLGIVDKIICLVAALKVIKKDGFQGAQATYRAKSVHLKMDNYINSLASDAALKWAEQKVNIRMAGMEVNVKELKLWYENFSGVKPSSSPENTNPVAVTNWLKKEVGIYLAKKNKWNEKPVDS